MSKPQSATKPAKPHPAFPLFPHACGQWAKKVRGKFYYFGPWADPQGALQQWLRVKDELLAGQTPAVWDPARITVAECFDLAIAAKDRQCCDGDLDEKSFSDYLFAGRLAAQILNRDQPACSLKPADFRKLREGLSAGRSPVTLRNLIRRIKVLINWSIVNGHIEGVYGGAQLWGTEFRQPSQRALRIEKQKQGPRFIPAPRIRRLIKDAPPQLKAMILLGINCAYGQSDVARLENRHVSGGWATLERGKTGKTRRASLWPETEKAVRSVLRSDDELVFRTKYGNVWDSSSISSEFAKLRGAGENCGFYWLRHTFLTVGEETKDFEAVRAIMGHVDASMAGQYREGVSDARLSAVTDYVRLWLLGRATATISLSQPDR